jgi:hypothetical protein
MPSEFDSTGNVISRPTQSYKNHQTARGFRIARNNRFDIMRREIMHRSASQSSHDEGIHKTGSPNLVPGRK